MASATMEPKEKTQPQSRHAGKNYRVLKPFGPWTNKDASNSGRPNVFDREEFVRLHPLPATSMKDKEGNIVAIPQQVDPATYHDDLMDRGLAMGVIVHDPNAKTTDTPLGPTNAKGQSNPIRESIERMQADAEVRRRIEGVDRSVNGKANRPADPDRVEAMARAGMV